MSIFNSLTTAVSGMDAQATAFTNLGNNIANSQTVGYKADTTAFQDFVSGSQGAGDFTTANADSVAGLTAQHVDRQGQTVSSMDNLAMSINGNGMFNVARSAGQATTGTPEFEGGYYTRNGEFYEDKNGYLVNPAGYYLEGYMTNQDGKLDTTKLTEINVKNNSQFRPTQTTKITQNAILPSHYVPGQASSYDTSDGKKAIKDPQSFQTQPVTTYDSNGKPHSIALSWQQSQYNPLSWTVKAYSADGTETTDGTTYNVNFDNEGHMKSVYRLTDKVNSAGAGGKNASTSQDTFTTNDGSTYKLESVGNELPDEPVNLQVQVSPLNGTQEQNINLDLGALGASSGTTLQVSPNTQPSQGSTLPTLSYTAGTRGTGGTIKVVPKNSKQKAFAIGSATGSNQSFMTAPTSVNGHEIALQFTERSPAEQRWTAQYVDLSNGNTAVSNAVTYQATPDTWQSGNSGGNPTAQADGTGYVTMVPVNNENFTPDNTLSGLKLDTPGNSGSSEVRLDVNSSSTPSVLTTDSVSSGNFQQAQISSDGSIVGVYDNGDTQLIGKVALTKFPDENGLSPVDGQAYQASTQSGSPETSMVGQNGTGNLSVGYVESSTTNLTGDLSNLIVAQEAYSANTKTVTTADEMLQTTIAMKQS